MNPGPEASLDLESAIIDAEGDMLLLSLAIGDLDRCFSRARPADAERNLRPILNEEQLQALTHAHANLITSVRKLTATFYGKGEGG